MNPVISVGNQDFRSIIENQYFYIDKTSFIKEWWENGDSVTLITRPRRFGKTYHATKAVWKNIEYEYDRNFFFK